MDSERTSGPIYFDPQTGLILDQGYQMVKKHIEAKYKRCPSCESREGFSVAEHVHVLPGFRLQSAHTVVLIMCNSCYEIRTLGAAKLGIDR